MEKFDVRFSQERLDEEAELASHGDYIHEIYVAPTPDSITLNYTPENSSRAVYTGNLKQSGLDRLLGENLIVLDEKGSQYGEWIVHPNEDKSKAVAHIRAGGGIGVPTTIIVTYFSSQRDYLTERKILKPKEVSEHAD